MQSQQGTSAYSPKPNINLLTALLIAHGVRQAVLCPGSRNAPIMSALVDSAAFTCHGVTDERSAGFVAMGLALESGEPVVVCVTSGSAVLNLAPAVSEAFYQHIPLIVVSADRPEAWIGQLDGQTLPQLGAFGNMVLKCVQLPEPTDDTGRWHCQRLINEALAEATHRGKGPVHINVPITEPLFEGPETAFPEVHPLHIVAPDGILFKHSSFDDACRKACRPMVVVGQMNGRKDVFAHSLDEYVRNGGLVLSEPLAFTAGLHHLDELAMLAMERDDMLPDMVVYIGGALVSKRFKQFMRQLPPATVWAVEPDGRVEDVFQSLAGVVETVNPSAVISCLEAPQDTAWSDRWARMHSEVVSQQAACGAIGLKQRAVKLFEDELYGRFAPAFPTVHYANSTAVRLGSIYAEHHVSCNRGVNGIEGSLSTAAGQSLYNPQKLVFCIIGDLSFFYDQNALWNSELGSNFRILLLNNGGGGIFSRVKGLQGHAGFADFTEAQHHTTAQGICMENGIPYLTARNEQQLEEGLRLLMAPIDAYDGHPVVLEVFTNMADDSRAVAQYEDYIKQNVHL